LADALAWVFDCSPLSNFDGPPVAMASLRLRHRASMLGHVWSLQNAGPSPTAVNIGRVSAVFAGAPGRAEFAGSTTKASATASRAPASTTLVEAFGRNLDVSEEGRIDVADQERMA
jgi:hypothetical protein